jgi:hypothetical protein
MFEIYFWTDILSLFVRQFVAVSGQLADNYCYTIERNIYYLDNYEHITPEFARMAREGGLL